MKGIRGERPDEDQPETVISGSFRKHMEEIGDMAKRFESTGIHVRAPKSNEPVNPDEKFVILASDTPGQPPVELEKDYMREIAKANFLYVADLDGYVGQSAATEMAYARLKGVPIITTEAIEKFSDDIPENIRPTLLEAVWAILPKDQISLANIQDLKERIAAGPLADLSLEQREMLRASIKRLFKDLRSIDI